MLNAANLRYHKPGNASVRDMISIRFEEFNRSWYGPFIDQFREQPFYNSPDMVHWLKGMMGCEEFKNLFDVN